MPFLLSTRTRAGRTPLFSPPPESRATYSIDKSRRARLTSRLWTPRLAFSPAGVRRCDRGARHALRGVVQRLHPHHAAAAGQSYPLDFGGRARRWRRGGGRGQQALGRSGCRGESVTFLIFSLVSFEIACEVSSQTDGHALSGRVGSVAFIAAVA